MQNLEIAQGFGWWRAQTCTKRQLGNAGLLSQVNLQAKMNPDNDATCPPDGLTSLASGS
jgi:hypothetical protein